MQRWRLGVIGPAAFLVWSASHQSWGWVAFCTLTLSSGVAQLFLGPVRLSQLARLTRSIVGSFFLAMGMAWLYLAMRLATEFVVGAALCLAGAFCWVTLGLLILWPAQTARVLHVLHIQAPTRPMYVDPRRLAGPNDVLPS